MIGKINIVSGLRSHPSPIFFSIAGKEEAAVNSDEQSDQYLTAGLVWQPVDLDAGNGSLRYGTEVIMMGQLNNLPQQRH
jgi:hypothetical protein